MKIEAKAKYLFLKSGGGGWSSATSALQVSILPEDVYFTGEIPTQTVSINNQLFKASGNYMYHTLRQSVTLHFVFTNFVLFSE
jgi:hypothetical protein